MGFNLLKIISGQLYNLGILTLLDLPLCVRFPYSNCPQHGLGRIKCALYNIPKYDDFVIDPDNNGLNNDIHGCYNMYHKFPHTPKAGTWK